MKVKIGPYKHFFGPYQLAEKVCFWAGKEKDEFGIRRTPDWVHDFGEFLAYGFQKTEIEDDKIFRFEVDKRKPTLLYKFLMRVNDIRGDRVVKVHIDRWDTWNMDSTLNPIILPMLKRLKEHKMGSPGDMLGFQQVGNNSMQGCFDFYIEDDQMADEAGHTQWNEIMDKMIWSFEQLSGDWESQFHHGVHDTYFEKVDGTDHSVMKRGPKDTSWFDAKGYQAHQARIQEGLELFGRYYTNLWD